MPQRDVPPLRKTFHYLGLASAGVGFLLFFSIFFTAMTSGDSIPDHSSMNMRAVSGFALFVVGGAAMTMARAGLAGSGVVLDPRRARKDLEPWARMSGGMLKDALDEAGVDLSRLDAHDEKEIQDFDVKLRKLHQLREDGILSNEEYEKEKAEILQKV